MMVGDLRRWVLAGGNILLPIAILVFASGFFPYKPFIAGRNEFDRAEQIQRPPPMFNRVVFMVVDALRSDFVYSKDSGFAFVQQLIRDGKAVPFTAHASSPTITMPKVKAITTGSVPSFLDVILNFAESDTTSTLAHMDTWLNQLRHMPDGKLVMYGDDTWLKLFPGFFARHDGTSSFFVSDFTEVDNNVTRHIQDELQQDDWNGWFMHYLGLDHIGHKSGPESPHMLPKQREMDSVVESIFRRMETEQHLSSTLFIICGDHGMNEAGNHGGAAPGETSPALVFMSPKFQQLQLALESPANPKDEFGYYEVVEQSDIAPTVAGLLGFPVPLNNLGVFIPAFLKLWPESQRLHLVVQNVRQIHRILEETIGPEPFLDEQISQVECEVRKSDLHTLQCGWLALLEQGANNETDPLRLESLYEYLHTAQKILSSTASNYDMTKLGSGIILATLIFISVLCTLLLSLNRPWDARGFVVVALLTGLYSAMMFASSFVEEEHHFWYWTSTAMTFYLFQARAFRKGISCGSIVSFALTLALLRVMRRWNQTGQKYAGSPDIGRTYLRQNVHVLWILVLGSYLFLSIRLASRKLCGIPRSAWAVFSVALGLCAAIFRVEFTRADAPELFIGVESVLTPLTLPLGLIDQARIVFTLISLGLGFLFLYHVRMVRTSSSVHQRKSTLAIMLIARDILSIFLATQTRVNNVPLLVLFEAVSTSLRFAEPGKRRRSSPIELAFTTVVLQHACFFAFGGTNAISSVDLSNAYNGVSGYNVVGVGILTFVSNWIGPVWWALAATDILASWTGTEHTFGKYALTMTFFVSGSLMATMIACTVLRTHLFIWTVFSPKYLYSMAWSLGQHLLINIGMTRVLLWAGESKKISRP